MIDSRHVKDERIDKILPYALVAIPVAFLARATISAVYRKVGHPGGTLDDAYIHFQYARAIAEGHPLRYHAGEPVTSGSTSLLWPVLLAPFWLLGFHGEALMWPAWIFSFVALGALAWEVRAIAEPLVGRATAIAAGAMVLGFSALTWCAASGMEVVPFAWVLVRIARRGSEWAEKPEIRSPRRRWELIALSWCAVLLRPEGALLAVAVTVLLAAMPSRRTMNQRLQGVLAFLAVLFPYALLKIATGNPRWSTAQVKLLAGNPYYPGAMLWETVTQNVRVLFGTLLNGEVWSAEFVPTGMGPLFIVGIACVAVQGIRTGKWVRAASVLLLAAMLLVPCTYVTFLWNRLRYLWPFIPAWFVGLACLARCVGDLLAQLKPRLRFAAPIAAGGFAGAFASHLPWAIDDVAGSASGIDRQQAAQGRWAKDNLPANARIGVNDTGAIAYFGDHPTFDIVGLTTAGEGRYWVAGSGSRLEHYERLYRERPSALPTHFIVYPEWMSCEAVLGTPLHDAFVTDSTILGGQLMRAYEADYSTLGSGELPWTFADPPIDVLDVADLESEAEHKYELLGARDNSEFAKTSISPSGSVVIDGGRTFRTMDRFVAHLASVPARMIVRLESNDPATIELSIDAHSLGTKELEPGTWAELEFAIPAAFAKPDTRIELRASGAWVTTFHYWFTPR
jgi:hypothetical protein